MSDQQQALAALVDRVVVDYDLNPEQAGALLNVAASWAMEGMNLTEAELRVGAELILGRIDFDQARRNVGA